MTQPDANIERRFDPQAPLQGVLHIEVACDWGDEVDLNHAARLMPSEQQSLSRRPRTPASIAYRPAPLRFRQPPLTVQIAELGPCQAEVDVTVFDFAAVNIGLQIPFTLTPPALLRLARCLAEPESLVLQARRAAEPLYRHLLPAIKSPKWSEVSEEYFVFQLQPSCLPPPEQLVQQAPEWLAGLLRLEDLPLSAEEVTDALRQRMSYTNADLVLIEWSAAVVIDRDCDEILQTMEFANLQLLEFRHIDQRVDDVLKAAYGLIHPLAGSWLPFWKVQTKPLRTLGDLRIEADVLFERASNALKLVGDQYVARLYRMLSKRFHLDEWAEGIHSSLDVAVGVYQVLSDQASAYRIEVLEIIVIVLIALEIVLALFVH